MWLRLTNIFVVDDLSERFLRSVPLWLYHYIIEAVRQSKRHEEKRSHLVDQKTPRQAEAEVRKKIQTLHRK